MLVIGAPNSSNSLRLAEVAERMGVPARLIERAQRHRLGLARPAARRSASPPAPRRPKSWCAKCVDALRERFDVTEEIADHTPERMIFKLPRELVA